LKFKKREVVVKNILKFLAVFSIVFSIVSLEGVDSNDQLQLVKDDTIVAEPNSINDILGEVCRYRSVRFLMWIYHKAALQLMEKNGLPTDWRCSHLRGEQKELMKLVKLDFEIPDEAKDENLSRKQKAWIIWEYVMKFVYDKILEINLKLKNNS
jgi:hypothetical protein